MRTFTILAALAALTVSSLATPATSLTKRAADYSNNCKGSGLCGSIDIRADCGKAIATVNAGASYTDQAQFSVGDCYSESPRRVFPGLRPWIVHRSVAHRAVALSDLRDQRRWRPARVGPDDYRHGEHDLGYV